MASKTIPYEDYTSNGESKTYSTAGHTFNKPKLVIQKRRLPSGNAKTATMTFSVVHGTTDVDGAVLPNKVSFKAEFSIPREMDPSATDVADALVIFRDLVNSDEFANATDDLAFTGE